MSQPEVTYRGSVYPWHCDHMGHMNVMWYVGKFDEASWQLISRLGLHRARFETAGTGMVAVEQRVEYKRELRAGDGISIVSTVLEVRNKSIRMRHEMRNDETGEVVATTEIVAVHIDAVLRKACALPADVWNRARLAVGCRDGEVTQATEAVLEQCG
jgi:acyl-CoA thioester hydrolase